jgi:osmotically-inducible protein OsmY
LVHRATHGSGAAPENDRVLVDKVRSEVLGRRPTLSHRVTVDAVDGVVTLRGEVESPVAIDELAAAVLEVAGVTGVTNLLHGPGQPAANKAEVRRVDV